MEPTKKTTNTIPEDNNKYDVYISKFITKKMDLFNEYELECENVKVIFKDQDHADLFQEYINKTITINSHHSSSLGKSLDETCIKKHDQKTYCGSNPGVINIVKLFIFKTCLKPKYDENIPKKNYDPDSDIKGPNTFHTHFLPSGIVFVPNDVIKKLEKISKNYNPEEVINSTKKLDSTGVNFSKVDFSGKDLTGANFTGAIFKDLTIDLGTNLSYTDFTGVHISKLNFEKWSAKNVEKLNLRGANLTGTNLKDKLLLPYASLKYATIDLKNLNLKDVDLTGVFINENPGDITEVDKEMMNPIFYKEILEKLVNNKYKIGLEDCRHIFTLTTILGMLPRENRFSVFKNYLDINSLDDKPIPEDKKKEYLDNFKKSLSESEFDKNFIATPSSLLIRMEGEKLGGAPNTGPAGYVDEYYGSKLEKDCSNLSDLHLQTIALRTAQICFKNLSKEFHNPNITEEEKKELKEQQDILLTLFPNLKKSTSQLVGSAMKSGNNEQNNQSVVIEEYKKYDDEYWGVRNAVVVETLPNPSVEKAFVAGEPKPNNGHQK